jgi:DASS family divalent anion:Na+ symporter
MYLMLVVYQADVVACALFLTGQASNPLAASQASTQTGGAVQLHYANWFLYALAPALVSLLAVPWLIYKLCPPAIRHTPEAPEMARRQLAELGPMSRSEWIMLVVFLGVCLAWIVTGFAVGPEAIPLVALGGAAVLFLTGVITWDDAVSEKGAWDVFLWYGGLVQMGKLLDKAGVVKVFAGSVADGLGGLDLRILFLLMLLVYFYAHYGFASITAHILAMYPAFVGVLLARGAPPWLTVTVFAYFANLCAGLTHYGTTPAPIVFGVGYVSHGTWWRIGLVASLLNVSVWLLVGLPWWKLWGLW